MNRIIINGVTVESNGRNSSISITNGKIVVDGNEIDIGTNNQNVTIEGDVGELQVTGRVEVKGNVKGNINAGGSVTCGNIGGDVDAGGSVSASGNVGDIDAGGSVSIRKG